MPAVKRLTQYGRHAVTLLALLYVWIPQFTYAAQQTTVDVCGDSGDHCNDFLDKYINPIIIGLSALVGVVAVISIIMAGIQYSASADDPGAVTKAKQRIFNTVIGLLAYIFLFAFLNYLIPGGIL